MAVVVESGKVSGGLTVIWGDAAGRVCLTLGGGKIKIMPCICKSHPSKLNNFFLYCHCKKKILTRVQRIRSR